MSESLVILESDHTYHIYNHAVGNENIFHFVVRIRSFEVISKLINKPDELISVSKMKILSTEEIALFLSQQFSNYFNSYAKAYNNENYRRGALFKRAFRREPVLTSDYLKRLIRYIHQNPVKDGFASEIGVWKYTSYNSILSSNPTLIPRNDVIELFGDLENFIFYHKQNDAGFEY